MELIHGIKGHDLVIQHSNSILREWRLVEWVVVDKPENKLKAGPFGQQSSLALDYNI